MKINTFDLRGLSYVLTPLSLSLEMSRNITIYDHTVTYDKIVSLDLYDTHVPPYLKHTKTVGAYTGRVEK